MDLKSVESLGDSLINEISVPEIRFLAAFAYHALLGLGTRSNQRNALGAASHHAQTDAPSTARLLKLASLAEPTGAPKPPVATPPKQR